MSVQFTGSSGTSPYTFSSTGTLPAGLSLSSAGLLSGTPTTATSYSFNVSVTDNASNTASTGFSVTVNPAPTLPSTTTYYHTAGMTKSIPLSATGGTGPISYSYGVLPTGASFSSGSLSIGTTVSSDFSFLLIATDDNGATAMQTYGVVVSPAFSLPSHTLSDAIVGQPYSATLPVTGGRAPITWSLTSNMLSGNGISVSSAGVVSGPATIPSYVSLSFTVQATDANGATASQVYSMRTVSDIILSPSALPPATVGRPYSATLSPSGSPTGNYSITLASGSMPSGLSLSVGGYASTGSLSGTPTSDGAFSFTVNVTDLLSQTRPANLSITVNAAPSITGPGTVTASAPNVPVSRQFTATGGTAPLTWSASGTYVSGTSFVGATGTYSGIPTTSGTSSFTVTVTDANGATATLAVTHDVYDALQLTHALPSNLTQTQTVAGAFTASGGAPTKTWSVYVGAIPTGLTLNPSTGAITGSPTSPGIYSATIRVTDSLSTISSSDWNVTVHPPPALGQLTLNSAPGQAVNNSLLPSGGVSPYQISVLSGALPSGIGISSNALAGTPTMAGVYSFTLQIQDANLVTATRAYTWNVAQTLLLQNLVIPSNTSVGATLNFPITTTGGLAPITFSVTGQVPPGMTFDAANALLSGAPSQTGAFSFTLRAEDSIHQIAERTFLMNVGSKPSISGTLPMATAGSPYSASLSIAAPGTLESATATSALPDGVSFSYSGLTATISGTPASAGQHLIDIMVEDKAGETASAVFPLEIRPALSIPAGQALPGLSTGEALLWTPQSQGGVAPIRWSLGQGSLPAGLSIDPANGQLSGRPNSNGDFAFTLSASDRNGSTATLTLKGSVAAGLKWSSSMWTSSQSAKNQVLSLPLQVEGGTAPYTFKLHSGNLPAGLALENGALTGTPTAAGNFRFTLLAQDSANRTASLEASLLIAGGLSVSPSQITLHSKEEIGKLTILAEPVGAKVALLCDIPGFSYGSNDAQVPAVINVSYAPGPESGASNCNLQVSLAASGESVIVPIKYEPRAQGTAFRSSVSSAPGHAFSAFVYTDAAETNFTLSLEGPGAASYRLQPDTGTAAQEKPFHASIEPLTSNGASGLEATLVVRNTSTNEEQRHTLTGLAPTKIRLSTNRVALKPGASFIATAAEGEAAYATIQERNFFKLDAPQGTLKPSSRISVLPEAGDEQAGDGKVTFYSADGNPAAQLEVFRPAVPAQGTLELDINAVHFPQQVGFDTTAQFTLSNPSSVAVPYTIMQVQPNGQTVPFTFSPESGSLAPGATQVITLKLSASMLGLLGFEIPLVVQYNESFSETVLVKRPPVASPGCKLSNQVTISPLAPYQGQPVAAEALHHAARVAILDACGLPLNTGKLTVNDGSKQSLILPNFTGDWSADWSPAWASQDWTLDLHWTDGTRSAQLRVTGPTVQ